MTQNFVPFGQLLIIFDLRQRSKLKIVMLNFGWDVSNYNLVTIPPNLWYAFYSATDDGVTKNSSDLAHDPSESEQRLLMHSM